MSWAWRLEARGVLAALRADKEAYSNHTIVRAARTRSGPGQAREPGFPVGTGGGGYGTVGGR